MLSSKIEQLITVLENQELDVSISTAKKVSLTQSCLHCISNVSILLQPIFFHFFKFQSSSGVSPQLYAELMAAYLYKNDL